MITLCVSEKANETNFAKEFRHHGPAPTPVPGAAPTEEQLRFNRAVARHEAEHGAVESHPLEITPPAPTPAPGSKPDAARRAHDQLVARHTAAFGINH